MTPTESASRAAPPRVLVVGDANLDLVLRGDVIPRFGQAEQLLDSADLVLGSSAGIVACGLARLGVETALSARVGDDSLRGAHASPARGRRRRHEPCPHRLRSDRAVRHPLVTGRSRHPHPAGRDVHAHRRRRP